MSGTASSATFKVGDKVWVPMPSGRAAGTVTEDRGPSGRGGRRLFYVSVPNHPYSSDVLLLGEDDMEPITEEEQAALYEPLDRQAVKDFLIRGGLFAILARNPAPAGMAAARPAREPPAHLHRRLQRNRRRGGCGGGRRVDRQ